MLADEKPYYGHVSHDLTTRHNKIYTAVISISVVSSDYSKKCTYKQKSIDVHCMKFVDITTFTWFNKRRFFTKEIVFIEGPLNVIERNHWT